jgi:hypothetical protein
MSKSRNLIELRQERNAHDYSVAGLCRPFAPNGASQEAVIRDYKHLAPTELSCQLHFVPRIHGGIDLVRRVLIAGVLLYAGFYPDGWAVAKSSTPSTHHIGQD